MIISLYFHIPFCNSKCDYCDFFSVPQVDKDIQKKVLDSIIEELKYRLSEIENPVIETVFFGGGTPSAIEPVVFREFLNKINKIIYSIKIENCEFSTEANPESCSFDFMSAAIDGGINRISLGVQSFNHEVLTILGRSCKLDNIFLKVDEIRDFWPEQFSLDIISGVTENYLQDLESALKLTPDHLSIYQLSVEEDTPLYQKILNNEKTAPNEVLQTEAIRKVCTYLEKSNYKRYEISNFSRDGKVCRHNIRYWDMQSYLGLGPSAVSSIYKSHTNYRTSNTKNIEKYINTDFSAKTSNYQYREDLNFQDFMIEHFLMGYRLVRGINENVFTTRFGQKSSEFIPSTALKWSSDGLLNIEKSALNEEGLLFLDSFLSDVFNEIKSSNMI